MRTLGFFWNFFISKWNIRCLITAWRSDGQSFSQVFHLWFFLFMRTTIGRSFSQVFRFKFFFLWERQSAGRFHRFLMRMLGHHTCNLILEYCSSQSIASLLNDPQAFLYLFFLFLKTKNPQVNSSHELDELVIWRIISLPRVDNPPLV